ncbi:MAG: hypothetical protein FWE95_07600 [Planctomycetaceae bacterium]|nr:hypothetical protein [Planctomycetaceae bacterium]
MTKAGDTFLLQDHKTGSRHLYVVISDPSQSSNEIFIGMISSYEQSYERYKEECCLLRVGDHPFIKHDSVVVYKIPPADLVSQSTLDQWQSADILKPKPPVEASVLKRIQQGYVHSRYQTDRIYQLLCRQKFID